MSDETKHSSATGSSESGSPALASGRNPNFLEIETELREALALAETATDFDIQEVVKTYLTAAADKRDRMAAVVRRLEAEQRLCDEEIIRLRSRKDAIGNAEERLRRYIIAVMQSIGETKLKGNTCTLALQKNPASVEILDSTLIPAEYKIIRYEIDRVQLRNALKDGKDVPGASLRDDQVHLRIR